MFVKRKWGHYLTFWKTSKTKWKLLFFRKGGEISNQRHLKRAEIWKVLFGEGVMTISEDAPEERHSVFTVEEGEECYIPVRVWHHFRATTPTLIFEKQYGICEESDIERI